MALCFSLSAPAHHVTSSSSAAPSSTCCFPSSSPRQPLFNGRLVGDRPRRDRALVLGCTIDTAAGQVTEVDKDTFWPIVKSSGNKAVVLDMYTQCDMTMNMTMSMNVWFKTPALINVLHTSNSVIAFYRSLSRDVIPEALGRMYLRCGPCKVMAPKFQELSQKYTDVIFLKLDCNQENKPLATELGIRVVPTFKILKDGKVVKEVKGTKIDDLVLAIETVRSS